MLEAEEGGRRVYEYEGQDCKSVLPTSKNQWKELGKRQRELVEDQSQCVRMARTNSNNDCNRRRGRSRLLNDWPTKKSSREKKIGGSSRPHPGPVVLLPPLLRVIGGLCSIVPYLGGVVITLTGSKQDDSILS